MNRFTELHAMVLQPQTDVDGITALETQVFAAALAGTLTTGEYMHLDNVLLTARKALHRS